MKSLTRQLLTGVVMACFCAWSLPASMAADAAPAARAEAKAEVTRTVLRRQDLGIADREVVMLAVQIPPGVAEGLHTHPADLFAFVEQGELTLEIEGQPAKNYSVGETAYIPMGKIHQGINHGQVPVKLAAVLVAQKGKPLTVPAP